MFLPFTGAQAKEANGSPSTVSKTILIREMSLPGAAYETSPTAARDKCFRTLQDPGLDKDRGVSNSAYLDNDPASDSMEGSFFDKLVVMEKLRFQAVRMSSLNYEFRYNGGRLICNGTFQLFV